MAVKLGELLIHNKLLTRDQLEDALQAQVIFGGKLGTILIEMGLISEQVLAGALSKLLKIPCAKPGELQKVPADVIRIFSPAMAEKYQAVPMALNGRNLTLAMADPHNLKLIDEISFRTGYIVRPVLGLEVRLVFALERHYGIRRTMRYIPPPNQVRQELDQLEGSPAGETEYLGIPGSEQICTRPVSQGPAPGADQLPEDATAGLEKEEASLAETALALVAARTRDDVADAAIRYLAAHYHRSALFMVVGGQISGWRSSCKGQPIPGFDEFQLSATEPTVLKTAIDSQSYFIGPLPASGANLVLLSRLGKPAPTTVLLLPLVMMGRVVGLIHLDDPEVGLTEALSDMQRLAAKILMAFELLILHNKILRT